MIMEKDLQQLLKDVSDIVTFIDQNLQVRVARYANGTSVGDMLADASGRLKEVVKEIGKL